MSAKRSKPPRPAKRAEVEPPARDLLLPSGRVDRSAVYRAAQAELAAKAVTPEAEPERAIAPGPVIDPDAEGDDDIVLPSASPQPQRVVFHLTRDLDKRLDKYLTDRISFMSRAKLQQLIEQGGVKVNGKPAKSSTNLRVNDTVEVLIEPPPAEDVPPQDIPIEVLFEDEHLIVLNKSPDIIVHPARSHLSGTMINALAFHFRNRSKTGGDLSPVGREFARPGVVHRLDRQTSGVIVFAKSDQAHWQLANQFQNRTVDKRYIALVHGRVEPLIDVIDEPLGPHPSREKGHREKQVVRHDHLGKPAVSVYRVLGVYEPSVDGRAKPGAAPGTAITPPSTSSGWKPAAPGAASTRRTPARTDTSASGPISLVEVELKTGRTHQIRVHLMHRGFPLIGDDLYGGKPVALPTGEHIDRVALHAALLSFRHPITKKPMKFAAHFPPDLGTFLRAVRKAKGAIVTEPDAPPGAVLTVAQLLAK